MKCRYCDNTIPSNIKFCAYCGTPLSEATAVVVPGAPAPVIPRSLLQARRGTPTWAKLLLGLVSLGLIVGVAVQFWPSDTHTNSPAFVQPLLPGTIFFVSNQDGNKEIYSIEANGGSQINLTNHIADDWDPVPSPNRNKITFVSNRDGNAEIYVMDCDGTNVVRLTTNDVDDMDPTWFPDGSRIIFARNVNNGKGYILDPRGNWEHRIFLMNADGSNQRRIEMDPEVVEKDYPLREYNNNQPAISPDGQRIAFTVESHWSGHPPVIYIMDSDGTNLSRLCGKFFHEVISRDEESEHYQMPRWSPDDNQIVFYSDSKQIYIMNLQQMTKKTVTSGEQASWSPDGLYIVFSRKVFVSDRGLQRISHIYITRVDGTEERQLTNNVGDDWAPTWSP